MLNKEIILESVKKYGTPQYLYDFSAIEKKLSAIKKLLPPSLKLYYAAKANPNLKLLELLKPLVDGIDLSSGGELTQCLLAKYDTKNMNLAGPGKTSEEIKYCIKNTVGSMSIESLTDLQRIITVAQELNKEVPVLIRINPSKTLHKFAVKMGGKATQFGVDEEDVAEVIAEIKKSKTISFRGFHIFSGTQCLDADCLIENFEYMFDLFIKLIEKHSLTVDRLNLGGGFGIPYFQNESEFNLNFVIEKLKTIIENFEKKTGQQSEYILELGRYLVAEAGYYVTRILNSKVSKGVKFYIIDGGMHHNLAAAGHLGQVIKKNYPIENISSTAKETEKVNLAGPLCTPLDTMATQVELPASNIDDVLVFKNSGAYAYTSSPLLFLGHDTPPEIVYRNNEFLLVRRSADIAHFN